MKRCANAKGLCAIFVTLIVLVLAGCGSAQKEVPSTLPAASVKPADSVAEPKASLVAKIGGTDRVSLKHLPLLLSAFGKEEAIQLEFKEYKGGTKAAQGLLTGEVDFGFLQAEHVLRDTSGEFRMVALVTQQPGATVVVNSKYKDQIKSVKDLIGKKVGISSAGAASHQFLLTLLKKSGIEHTDVNFQPVGLNAPEVFETDQVVAMYTIEPFTTQVVESGKAFILIDARKAEGTKAVYGVDSLPWTALVTRKSVISTNPELVASTTSALVRSLADLHRQSVDQVVHGTPAEMFPNGDPAFFRQILESNRSLFSADGSITPEMLAPLWANLQENGGAPQGQPLPFTQMVETRFLNQSP